MYKVTELSEFYKELETDKQLATEKLPEPRTQTYRNELAQKKNPAEGLIYLGDKQKKVAEELNVVEKMLKDVANGISGAMGSLINKFSSKEEGSLTIKLPKNRVGKDGSLLDEQGVPIDKYGVKEIESDEQRKRLRRNIEIAMLYLPDIKMTEIKSANGKTIALVTGADSKEFNAVVKAHREKEKLMKESEALAQEKKNLMVSVGLNPDTEVKSAGNKAPESIAITPAAKEVPSQSLQR